MIRKRNDEVVRRFLEGGEPAQSHAKSLRYEDGILHSYADEIARRLSDGTILIRSQDEARSATSAAHVNKIVIRTVPSKSGARMSYERLRRWKLSPGTIQSAREFNHFESRLQLFNGNWLYRPPMLGIPFVRQFAYFHARKVFMLNTWWLFDGEPVSPWHAIQSAVGGDCWQGIARTGAYMFGHWLFVPQGTSDTPIRARRTKSLTSGGNVFKYEAADPEDLCSPPFLVYRPNSGGVSGGVIIGGVSGGVFNSQTHLRFRRTSMQHPCLDPDEDVLNALPVPLIKDWL